MKTLHAFRHSLLLSNTVYNTIKLSLAFVCIVAFSCCSSMKNMDRLIAREYGDAPVNPIKKKSDYIAVQTNLIVKDSKPSLTVKEKRKMLPLFFYWNWDYLNLITLNPNIPIASFNTTILSYANTKGLKDKLNGRKIELSIDSIPNLFSIEDKGWLVYVILGHFGNEVITINPHNKNLVVSYNILQDNIATKTGVINIDNHDPRIRRKFFQGSKKMTKIYLGSYDENIKLMSKKVIDALMLEL